MKITFKLRRDDLWNFNKYVISNAPVLKRSFIMGFAATPVLLLVVGIMMHLKPWLVAIETVAGGLIGAYILILFAKQQLYKSIGNGKGVLGEHTIEIEPKGLRETTDVNQNFHKWNGVQSIESDKKYIYVFIGNYMAHIIPKSAFKSDEEAEEFLNTAISYWGKNR